MVENRSERLRRDFHEMLKIQDRPYLSWIATKGELPFAEEYLLHVRLRSYILSVRDGRYIVGTAEHSTVKVTLWDSYPNVAPNIRMLSLPPVFHPFWYSKGTYSSPEQWRPEISLKDYVVRMLCTLRFDPSFAETDAPANYKALDWFRKNRGNAALFPSDKTELTENSLSELVAAQEAAFSPGEIIDSWPAG